MIFLFWTTDILLRNHFLTFYKQKIISDAVNLNTYVPKMLEFASFQPPKILVGLRINAPYWREFCGTFFTFTFTIIFVTNQYSGYE